MGISYAEAKQVATVSVEAGSLTTAVPGWGGYILQATRPYEQSWSLACGTLAGLAFGPPVSQAVVTYDEQQHCWVVYQGDQKVSTQELVVALTVAVRLMEHDMVERKII